LEIGVHAVRHVFYSCHLHSTKYRGVRRAVDLSDTVVVQTNRFQVWASPQHLLKGRKTFFRKLVV
jgi:hypothetical protein